MTEREDAAKAHREPIPRLPTAEEIEAIQRAAFEEARELGLRQGHAEGLASGQAEIARRAATLERLISALARPFDELDAQVEHELVQLAITLAQALVRRELRLDPGQVVAVVQEALAALPVASRKVRVCLHPEDLPLVAEALPGHNADDVDADWRLQEDLSLRRGDCRIQSEHSLIDASMEKRLAAVVAQLAGGEREDDATMPAATPTPPTPPTPPTAESVPSPAAVTTATVAPAAEAVAGADTPAAPVPPSGVTTP